MPVHVSIHDVSPAWAVEVERALDLAHAQGVRPALLVVPNFHGSAPLLEHPSFCARLRELEREGHEIYLHGFFHQARPWTEHVRAQAVRGGVRERVAARARFGFAQAVVSGGESEFSDVSTHEAHERLDEGERVLREAGLTIKGFVAPAWSMPAWVHTLLGERGYTFTEDHLRVYDPKNKRSRASVVLNYASRSPGRLISSVAWCRLAKPARAWLPVRLAIHPADMRYALLRHEIEHLLRWAEGDFAPSGASLLSMPVRHAAR